MARVLFVVPPLTGHVNPTVSVAAALEKRGHTVAWVAHPRKVRPLLSEGAHILECDDEVPEALVGEMRRKSSSVRGLSGLKFLWEDFLLPLARAMVPQVDAAVERFRPDVLVVDQQALAGGIVARQRGLPWATSATTSAGVTDPLSGLPKVKAWLVDSQAALQIEHGLEPLATPDLSPHAVIIFSTPALVGEADFPAHFAFVGPSIRARSDHSDFPWDALDPGKRRVLVSLGTVNADRGRRFFEAVCEAFRGTDLQGVLVAPAEQVVSPPPNLIVREWVPQLALLEHMHAVVSHAGHNTVCETLAHGLPLVVAPIKDDQPVVATQVEAAGCGVRVKFGRLRASTLRDAVHRVLDEPSYRIAAERVRASFEQAGGAEAASRVVEGLL